MDERRRQTRGEPLVRTTVDPEEPVSVAVIELVALVSDTLMEDLPLLYSAVDPEALEAFVEGSSTGEVAFRYAGYVVSVTADRELAVYESDR